MFNVTNSPPKEDPRYKIKFCVFKKRASDLALPNLQQNNTQVNVRIKLIGPNFNIEITNYFRYWG